MRLKLADLAMAVLKGLVLGEWIAMVLAILMRVVGV